MERAYREIQGAIAVEQTRERRIAHGANGRIAEENLSRKTGAAKTASRTTGGRTDAAISDLERVVKRHLGEEAPEGVLFERAPTGRVEAYSEGRAKRSERS